MLQLGAQVEERYRIVGVLGRGANAAVFEARALPRAFADHGRRRVALKVLSRRVASDPDAVSRFTHEAYLGMQLRHRGLPRVLDFGALPDGRPYLAMELGRGASLDRIIQGPLPPALAVDIIEETAMVLSVLHERNIVHRDVKPANLLVELRPGARPRVKLLDLGAASGSGMGGPYGTPAYIAPEQALGLAVDARADVYALACVAYRLLTGGDA